MNELKLGELRYIIEVKCVECGKIEKFEQTTDEKSLSRSVGIGWHNLEPHLSNKCLYWEIDDLQELYDRGMPPNQKEGWHCSDCYNTIYKPYKKSVRELLKDIHDANIDITGGLDSVAHVYLVRHGHLPFGYEGQVPEWAEKHRPENMVKEGYQD